ncbi:hypothetical protein C8R47DRAFT_1227861 [Mycena vitilis]|nr:hypothetical protein C8R47DRAFT_1227861 [Mycena vitilis]
MEAQLRESQCGDALSSIRLKLHSKSYLISFRHENIMGQIRVMRARSLVDHIGIRVDALARKYRDARTALLALRGAGYAPHLRPLEDHHLRLEGDVAENETAADKSDRTASEKLRGIGGRPSRDALSESNRPLSWIWTAPGALDDREQELHKLLHMEWSMAKARKTGWEEEVELLREEMKRVLRYLEWEAGTWVARGAASEACADITEEARSGLEGYALVQAAQCRELCDHFCSMWSLGVDAATDAVGAGGSNGLASGGLGSLFTQED